MSTVVKEKATTEGPAGVGESGAFANTPGYMGEGVLLDTEGKQGMSVAEALRHSGLDWTVEKVPIYAGPVGEDLPGSHPIKVPGRHGVQRTTDGHVLGVVGDTWQPVQNHEGFALIEDFMQGDTAYIEAAGATDGGKKVWILAHMTEDMQIAGEDIARYVLFTNGHDGRMAVTAAMTDIRVMCQNFLTLALGKAKRIHRVRHTTKATERLAEAKTILGIRDKQSEELARQGEWLVEQEMSDRQFDKFLERLMPIPEDQEGKPADTMISDRRDAVRTIYNGADNLNNIRGTRWGALNAVVEYADYGRKFRDEGTQVKAQFGLTATPIKDQALGLLTVNAPKSVVPA